MKCTATGFCEAHDGVHPKKDLLDVARSVVDLRQPFFKENGKVLTVGEKMKQIYRRS